MTEAFITTEELMMKAVQEWCQMSRNRALHPFAQDILDYLRSGVKAPDFEIHVKSAGNTHFFNAVASNYSGERNSQFYQRVLYLSLQLQYDETLYYLLSLMQPFTPEHLAQLAASYQVTWQHVIQHLAWQGIFLPSTYKNYDEILKTILTEMREQALAAIAALPDEKIVQFLAPVWEFDRERGFDLLLARAESEISAVRKKVAELLSGYEPGFPAFKQLLQHKKKTVREMAVKLLASLLQPEIADLLKQHAAQEKSAPVKALIEEYFAQQEAAKNQHVAPTKAVILERIRAKAPKRFDALEVETLPTLRWAEDDTDAPVEAACYLLSAMSGEKSVIPSAQLRQIGGAFTAKSLHDFANAIYERWDQETKTKWMLGVVAAFGDDRLIDPLRRQIEEFVEHNRGAMASELATVLALLGSPRALQTVDKIARKIRHKQVKTAAQNALDTAAKELGLSLDELRDRLIPDFGFAQDGTRLLDYGTRQFTLSLSPALECVVRDASGKTFAALPKPGKNDDPALAPAAHDLFKSLKKEIKEQVSLVKDRLEDTFWSQRFWKQTAWTNLFVKNPLMHSFALGLIWGVYEQNALQTAFRYMEDGSFTTVNEDEFTLPEHADIGLIHPLELAESERGAWLQQLQDYDISQPLPQLQRAVFTVDPAKAKETVLSDFKGYMISRVALKSKLFQKHWERGSVQDAGGYYDYYKEHGGLGIGVQLNFFGDWVGSGYEDGKEVPVYDVVFYNAGTVRRGSYIYDTPKPENMLPLDSVPPRFYSEIYYELKTILNSGSGFNPEWEKVKW